MDLQHWLNRVFASEEQSLHSKSVGARCRYLGFANALDVLFEGGAGGFDFNQSTTHVVNQYQIAPKGIACARCVLDLEEITFELVLPSLWQVEL